MKIKKAAIKTPSAKVVSKPKPAHHKDIDAKGEHGFITSDNKFASRQEAKKIAKKSGQADIRGKRGLHSHDMW